MYRALGPKLGGRCGNPIQYSCLEDPMDRGAWWGTAHGITKSWIWLSDGWEEVPHARGQGRRPGGDTPHPRSGAAAERSNPMSKERWLRQCRRAKRSYSTCNIRRGGCEEIPLVQGKEQRLCFAGAAMKRYPMSKVRETQVRQYVLRETSEGRHTNHNHRKLVSQITQPQPCLTQWN